MSSMDVDAPRSTVKPAVDREKTCPSLIRAFVKTNGYHNLLDFERELPVQDEYQIYTWKDATLREIVLLLRDVLPPAYRSPAARFSIRLVFMDTTRGRFGSKELGSLVIRDLSLDASGAAARDQDRTLEELRFVVGDYLDIHVVLPDDMASLPPRGFARGPPGPGEFGARGQADAEPRWSRGGGFAGRGGGRGGFGGGRGGFGRDDDGLGRRPADDGYGPPRGGPPRDAGYGPRRDSGGFGGGRRDDRYGNGGPGGMDRRPSWNDDRRRDFSPPRRFSRD